jgi:predicted RNase H-like HicB family nuclease
MTLNNEKSTDRLSDSEAIDRVFNDLIWISKDADCFVAVDYLTHMAEVGSTEAEAVENLKQAIREHISAVKSILEQMRDFDRALREQCGR